MISFWVPYAVKNLFLDMVLNRNRIQTLGKNCTVPKPILEPPVEVEVLIRRLPVYWFATLVKIKK